MFDFFNTHKVLIVFIAVVTIGVLWFATQDGDISDEEISSSETTEQTTEGGVDTTVPTKSSSPASAKPAPPEPKNAGRVVFAITDAAANLENIDSILMTLSGVTIHSPRNGWVSLLSESKVYDLLFLKKEGKFELMLDMQLEAGTYNQLQLSVGPVVVLKGGIAHTVKMPSGKLHIPFLLVVEKDKISTVMLDVLADKSLHTTGKGSYIFTPVLHVNTRTDVDTIQKAGVGGKKIDIIGGTTRFDATLGMDENGDTKINYIIDSSNILDVVRNVLVLMPYTIDQTDFTVSAEEAMDKAINTTSLSKATSVRLVEKGKARAWQIIDTRTGSQKSVFIDALSGEIISIE